jgi:hypothetical protein
VAGSTTTKVQVDVGVSENAWTRGEPPASLGCAVKSGCNVYMVDDCANEQRCGLR